MMENMIGELARTMQRDRRAQSAANARLAEIAPGPDALGRRARAARAAIAKALIALAMRLAPPASSPAQRTGVATNLTP